MPKTFTIDEVRTLFHELRNKFANASTSARKLASRQFGGVALQLNASAVALQTAAEGTSEYWDELEKRFAEDM